ncbi:ATP-dependent helicase [Hydrogenophaga sp. NFH-34]|uniref:ATP-dependent helicase n=1 Tax=Hydrogenophaga sp. NFH-34 TaxID=2744446 RepID=UPI001F3CC449|nr:ATP-dependent helicase [Hydrogenophaga sp. NFH-34]
MSEIQSQIDSLNPEQKEVALCMGHCLAIAAPGSGKTKTLAVKAAYLLDKGHTVTAVTFTRDAALELRDRIIALTGREALPNLLVGTFHSIDLLMAFPGKARSGMGSNILKAGHSRLTRQWEIVKEATRRSIVDRAIAQAGLAIERDEGTRLIETIKSGYAKPGTDQEAQLVKAYAELLRRHGVIDFQDILLETNKAMANGQISPLRTDHLMIDEFQDTDTTQFQWAMHHAAGSVLTAVGDDDQSIYGFRRALGYKGMADFHDQLQATRIVLGMNYRSHSEVLEPSAMLIGKNQDRMEKELVSFKGPGGDAFWDRFGTRTDEARNCHEWIRAALDRGESAGVLARTNKRLDTIEVQCVKNRTPYIRGEGGSILQSREMAVFTAAIGLLTRDNMLDADEVLAWMKLTEEDIDGIHRSLGKTGFMRLDRAGLQRLPLAAEARSKVSTLVKRSLDWRKILDHGGVNFVVDRIFALLNEHVGEDKRAGRALEVIKEIFLKPVGSAESGIAQMASRLEHIRALMEGRKKKDDGKEEPPSVALITAHGSKGLEWDNVWIVGAEHGAFPDESASVQEERRLFFVAMTRARKHLRVSASGTKPLSAFVDDAGLLRTPEPVALPAADSVEQDWDEF